MVSIHCLASTSRPAVLQYPFTRALPLIGVPAGPVPVIAPESLRVIRLPWLLTPKPVFHTLAD
ncbi:hypothetical protein HO173_010303 [Letharia columbiana]|uniref:Uncharacterized protein n=1 Tax=Letharia columbiana TaxID=112416 RepID=A0A8H6FN12_9LECA|nr:uncharacterized protein HO173_010303 [Letharia columbiana]KAF6231551.1 hypothetical protein HO173_010303 [Letharia columbiana]